MMYKKRLELFTNLLQQEKVDSILLDDITNIYYLTGIQVSEGKIFITKERACFIIDGRYFEQCKKKSPIPCHLAKTKNLKESLPENILEKVQSIAFDSNQTSFKSYQELKRAIDDLGETIDLKPLDRPLLKIRKKKDPQEIQTLKDAAALGSRGYDFVCSLITEGVSEIELATELEIFWRKNGGDKLAFDPIIAFGPNSSNPHYTPTHTKLKPHQNVLIDIGVSYQHYQSDMTRVVFYKEPEEEIKKIYNIVRKAQEAALKACRPGITLSELDLAARNHIKDNGYGEYFVHSLGHGVGLDIHEYPGISSQLPKEFDDTLEKDMIITVEPGIYVEGIGGVRIEDTILITENGYEDLTCRSKDIKVIS